MAKRTLKNAQRVTIIIESADWAYLRRYAFEHNSSASRLVGEAIKAYLPKLNLEPAPSTAEVVPIPAAKQEEPGAPEWEREFDSLDDLRKDDPPAEPKPEGSPFDSLDDLVKEQRKEKELNTMFDIIKKTEQNKQNDFEEFE